MNRYTLAGIFYIFIVPAVIVIGSVVYVLMSVTLMIGLMALLALVYAAFMSGKMEYGPKQIRRVRIPEIPTELEDLLKTTTNNGELMYVYLISVFGDDRRLSQTELYNRVKEKYETQLTLQSIRNYIMNLENNGLISSPMTPREREYSLTDRGHWCAKAINVCFPRTLFSFVVRYFLGFRRLPEYSHDESHQPIETESQR